MIFFGQFVNLQIEASRNVMKLKAISEIRRKELRVAAFLVLQEEGLTGTTLEKVAAKAGASKGIVLHYFKNKQEVFEHAMREANAALRDNLATRLKQSLTPTARLDAIIEVNFDPQFFRQSVCQGWMALCAAVPYDPVLWRIQKAIHARMRSNLIFCLKGLVQPNQVNGAALAIAALIDGLWIRHAMQTDTMSREDAVLQVKTLVGQFIQQRVG